MLTKKHILKYVSEEDLMKNLVPDFNPNIKKKNYKSIFSDKDDRPSMSIYKDITGKLKFKSFNTGHQGDIFQMYADFWGLNSRTQFTEILNKINLKLNLGINTEKLRPKNQKYKIDFCSNYTNIFLEYWNQFGVNEKILSRYNVKQTKKFSFNKYGKTFSFLYAEKKILNICYSVNSKIKLYTPKISKSLSKKFNFKQKEKRFCFKDQTNDDIFGLAQLPKKGELDYILLTAGEKDCLVSNAHGFPAISLQSENQLPTEKLLKELKTKTKCILVCYDNDTAGKNAMLNLKNKYNIESITLPDNVNDIADFFVLYDSNFFSQLITKSRLSSKLFNFKEKTASKDNMFHIAEAYIFTKYNIRYNEIEQDYEISKISENSFKTLNIKALYVEIRKQDIKVSLKDVDALIHSDFCQKYNPIKNYFESLPSWDTSKPDHIKNLAEHVKTDKPQEWIIALKKWLVRAVKSVFEENYFNKHALILVQSKQNTGKTSFCRFLCPPALKKYISESINVYDKDSRIALCTNFLINLDELTSFSSKNMSSLKSILSADKINIRLPYARKSTSINRICSFVGSTNNSQFLTDGTGNVRWLCFDVNEIDFTYNNTLTGKSTININDVYAQAFYLYKNGFNCELTKEEIQQLEGNNQKYKCATPELEYILEYFEPSNSQEGQFFNATKIADYIQERTKLKINPISIGRALTEAKFPRSNSKNLYGYWIKFK